MLIILFDCSRTLKAVGIFLWETDVTVCGPVLVLVCVLLYSRFSKVVKTITTLHSYMFVLMSV